MRANEDECLAAGLDTTEVERIAKGITRYAKQADALGLTIFGGTASGTLRFDDGQGRPLIVADLGGNNYDGGDGGSTNDACGLLRGE